MSVCARTRVRARVHVRACVRACVCATLELQIYVYTVYIIYIMLFQYAKRLLRSEPSTFLVVRRQLAEGDGGYSFMRGDFTLKGLGTAGLRGFDFSALHFLLDNPLRCVILFRNFVFNQIL